MPKPSAPLTAAVEAYFADLRRVRASGGATGERSSYGPLAHLLNAVGRTLRPKVFCVAEMADQGAGHPDFGLYAAAQVQKGRPRDGQAPERGVVEVKTPRDDPRTAAVREQVSRYWGRYRLVLVTNLRAFELVGADDAGEERRSNASCSPPAPTNSTGAWRLRAAGRTRTASFASPIGRSTIGGCIGRRIRNCWTRNAPTTGLTFSMATCGFRRRSIYERMQQNRRRTLRDESRHCT